MEDFEDKHLLLSTPLFKRLLKAREKSTKPNVADVAGNVVTFAVPTKSYF